MRETPDTDAFTVAFHPHIAIFGGREATTGNTSALRRLPPHSMIRYHPIKMTSGHWVVSLTVWPSSDFAFF